MDRRVVDLAEDVGGAGEVADGGCLTAARSILEVTAIGSVATQRMLDWVFSQLSLAIEATQCRAKT